MQVSYKTISTLEFDVLTNSYKTVDKQVEDTSGGFSDNAFYELLMGLESGKDGSDSLGIDAGSDFNMNGSLMEAGNSPQIAPNAANAELGGKAVSGFGETSLNPSLLSMKFSSDSLFAVSNDTESIKNSLMSELLAAV